MNMHKFEKAITGAVLLLLVVLVTVATLDLFLLLMTRGYLLINQVHSVADLQEGLQKGFGGVLLVLLGLELIETVKVYTEERHVRLEIIFIVAMIAVGRHIIQLDYHHTDGLHLAGLSGMMVSLAVGYYLIKKSMCGEKVEQSD